MPEESPIRLLIADDHRLVVDGIISILRAERRLVIVATATDGRQLLELSRQHDYDVCLLDISMPGLDGVATARLLRQEKPLVRIIILTTYTDKQIIDELLGIGISGYMVKNSTKQELVEAIRKVAGGGVFFSSEVNAALLEHYSRDDASRTGEAPQVRLTQRESEIVRLLSREYTNEMIAASLNISYRTVETHRKNIMQKTKSKNLAGLLRFAYGQGILR